MCTYGLNSEQVYHGAFIFFIFAKREMFSKKCTIFSYPPKKCGGGGGGEIAAAWLATITLDFFVDSLRLFPTWQMPHLFILTLNGAPTDLIVFGIKHV